MSDDSRALVEYLRRAYHAVDGLWFMMVEERLGFAETLEFDRRVWEVLAKIQARKAREVTGCAGDGPEALARCFGLKLQADGHRFRVTVAPEAVTFTITACPWLELLQKSDREHLAREVAQAICPAEGRVWSAEFGERYDFGMPAMACAGADHCEMRFALRVSREGIAV